MLQIKRQLFRPLHFLPYNRPTDQPCFLIRQKIRKDKKWGTLSPTSPRLKKTPLSIPTPPHPKQKYSPHLNTQAQVSTNLTFPFSCSFSLFAKSTSHAINSTMPFFQTQQNTLHFLPDILFPVRISPPSKGKNSNQKLLQISNSEYKTYSLHTMQNAHFSHSSPALILLKLFIFFPFFSKNFPNMQ